MLGSVLGAFQRYRLPPNTFHKAARSQPTRRVTEAKSKEPENSMRHKEPPDMTISHGFLVPKSPGGRKSLLAQNPSSQTGSCLRCRPPLPAGLILDPWSPKLPLSLAPLPDIHRHQTLQHLLTQRPQHPSFHPVRHFCLRNRASAQPLPGNRG